MKKVLVILMAVYLFGFSLFAWLKPADEFSDTERRALKQFPTLSVETILKGSFMSNFESYALEQFPLRDTFRGIKSAVARFVMRQSDTNDLYLEDGYIVSMEYPMDEKALEYAAGRLQNVYEMYMKDKDVNVYFSIIPDKNYFLAEQSGHLSMDYDLFIETMTGKVPFMNYIDIMDELTIEDYYKTDTHWNQIGIQDVANVLVNGMGAVAGTGYEHIKLDTPFYGVYYGQLALPVASDEISYLLNDTLKQCIVYDYQNGKEIPVYDMEKATGKDPYEMFLGGPLSLVTIENPNATSGKELILFRDSFGSSIAPLLVEGYEKVTLVDIRYMQPAMLEKFITFDNQDVLFLYSTSVLNNSSTIK